MDFHPNLKSTGLLLLIQPTEPRAHQLASDLVAALQPPLGAPGAVKIIGLLTTAVAYVVGKLHRPTATACDLNSDIHHLHTLLMSMLGDKHQEASLGMRGQSSRHPIWYQLFQLSDLPKVSTALLTYIGCEVLLYFKHHKPVAKTAAGHWREMSDFSCPWEVTESILFGFVPDDHANASWTSRLPRKWREVVKHFSEGDIPPPSWRDRVTSQLLGAGLNPTAAHAAGALDHRQLSPQQLLHAYGHINAMVHADQFDGAIGVLAVRTGLTVDLLVDLPLDTCGSTQKRMLLDPLQGIVEVDLSSIAHEAADALPGCHPGGYRLQIHLPIDLVRNLKTRSTRYPLAMHLKDLYPGEQGPLSAQPVFRTVDEIEPTWARLRNSTGPHLLRQGVNALHAALVTLDLSLICRSKFYYANLTKHELQQAEARLYQAVGWSEPVDGSGLQGFGCRVVPLDSTIRSHDFALLSQLEEAHPGKHSNQPRLIQHHNLYTYLTAWRLSILLALRASSQISIPADVDCARNWIPHHDKRTHSDLGFQPIALCSFAAQTIHLYRSHCSALSLRASKLFGNRHALTTWSSSVGRGQNVRLLFQIDQQGRVHPVASRDFTKSLGHEYTLPHDVGRKVIENHLRLQGLSSHLIDMQMRHSHSGQVQLSSFHHTSVASSMARLCHALDHTAVQLFNTPQPGLRAQ